MNTMTELLENGHAIAIPAGDYYLARTADMLMEEGLWTDFGWADPNAKVDADGNWIGTVQLIDGTNLSVDDFAYYENLIESLAQFDGSNNGFHYGIGFRTTEFCTPSDLDFLLRYKAIAPITMADDSNLVDADKIPEDLSEKLNIDEEVTYAIVSNGVTSDANDLVNLAFGN